MATSHDVARPQLGDFVHYTEVASATAKIEDTANIRSDVRIERCYISVPSTCTFSLKLQLPDSGPLVTLFEATATPTVTDYAVSAGTACPSGSSLLLETDTTSGDKAYTPVFIGG